MAMHDYLYAIVDRLPRAWSGAPLGIGGAPVEARTVASFLILRSRTGVVPCATPKTLAVHHDVVASAMDTEALLPFRFGTAVPSGEIEAWLMTHAALLRATVAKLRGCVEMNVKLLRLELGGGRGSEPFGDADSRRTAQLEVLGERLVARAGIEDWQYRVQGRGGNVAASVAFLVPRGEVHDFLTRIAPIASRAGGVAVVPTGPWPAYSFVPTLGPAVAFDRFSRMEAPGQTAHRRVS